jgi:phosphoribosyl-AMP cyclohydrolase
MKNRLVPTIIQDYRNGIVYMLGYMNTEALKKTRQTGHVYFWSRSKKRLWMKGEESGNTLKVKEILVDCDYDTLLVKAELNGKNVCHTGNITCFYTQLKGMYET